MKKYKIEFLYDGRHDITNIYIWLGMSLKDSRTLPGQLTKYTKEKVQKEILKELFE